MYLKYQDKDSNNRKREKLKCIISYFNIAVAQSDCYQEELIFLRAFSNREEPTYEPLFSVEVGSFEKTPIESYYGEQIMVDFANKKIGGGVLRSGCVQE